MQNGHAESLKHFERHGSLSRSLVGANALSRHLLKVTDARKLQRPVETEAHVNQQP